MSQKAPFTCSVCISVTDLALLRHVDGRNRISTPEIRQQAFMTLFSEN